MNVIDRSDYVPLLGAAEIAKWLGVWVAWVRDHATRKSPSLAAVKAGKPLRFAQSTCKLSSRIAGIPALWGAMGAGNNWQAKPVVYPQRPKGIDCFSAFSQLTKVQRQSRSSCMSCCTLNLTDYLSEGQLAAFLGVNVNTLKKWRCIGRGPSHVKFGRRTLYPKVDVLDWIERQRKDGNRKKMESMVLPVSIPWPRISRANRFGSHQGKHGARERAREAAQSRVAAGEGENPDSHGL
jgi:hypothetical protein